MYFNRKLWNDKKYRLKFLISLYNERLKRQGEMDDGIQQKIIFSDDISKKIKNLKLRSPDKTAR